MNTQNNCINFRNNVQRMLWICELTGQLSDGYWENAEFNHYKKWCSAKTNVDPENLGVNFHARKNNYNLVAKALYDSVGYRMEAIANMAHNGYHEDTIRKFNDHYQQKHVSVAMKYDMTDEEVIEAYRNNYWIKSHDEMIKIFGSYENLLEARKGPYGEKEVKNELRDMKKIIKMSSK